MLYPLGFFFPASTALEIKRGEYNSKAIKHQKIVFYVDFSSLLED